MQNNIDKYFKEKLDHRQFEMKEVYWEQAQKVLEENDRRRRRGMIWWWGGGVLAVLFVATIALYLSGQFSGEELTGLQVVEQKINSHSSTGETDKKIEQIGNNTTETLKEKIQKVESEEVTKRVALNKNNYNNVSSEKVGDDERNKKVIKGVGPNNSFKRVDKGVTIDEEVKKEMELKKENKNMFQEKEKTGKNIEDYLLEIKVLKRIPSLDLYVELNEVDVPNVEDKIEPPNNSKLIFGIHATQFFQPTPKDNEQSAIAFQAGILFKYKWNKKNKFHLHSGLTYERRTGSFERSKMAESRNYRFGLELDTNMLRPSSLHYISLPVLIGFEKGRHVIESGFSMHYLLGVRGDRGKIDRVPDSSPPRRDFISTERDWIDEYGIKKLNVSTDFNYLFKVNQQWAFGLSASYIWGGILKSNNSSSLINGEVQLREDDDLKIGIRAVYFLR